jgi:hypothetical protein
MRARSAFSCSRLGVMMVVVVIVVPFVVGEGGSLALIGPL